MFYSCFFLLFSLLVFAKRFWPHLIFVAIFFASFGWCVLATYPFILQFPALLYAFLDFFPFSPPTTFSTVSRLHRLFPPCQRSCFCCCCSIAPTLSYQLVSSSATCYLPPFSGLSQLTVLQFYYIAFCLAHTYLRPCNSGECVIPNLPLSLFFPLAIFCTFIVSRLTTRFRYLFPLFFILFRA